MRDELGLTKEQAVGLTIREMYTYLKNRGSGMISVLYTIDDLGDYKKSKIATHIFSNLTAKDKLQVIGYMEEKP